MASANTGEGCMGWTTPDLMRKIKGLLEGFCRTTGNNKKARIWHGVFSYPLIPNTAIKNFHNMSPVTSIDAGNCYVCIFEHDNYQGNYQIICPGEKIQVGNCASVVVGAQKLSVDAVRKNTVFPNGYWEMDGPMYMMHFSSGYRYV